MKSEQRSGGWSGRLRKAIRKRGWGGTLNLIGWKVADACANRLLPSRYHARRQDREFDGRFGVDTSGIIELNQLRIDSPHVGNGTYYEQTKPDAFKALMKHLNIRYEDFVFVDFGSGKGRALMLAAEYPFQRIIGVEFAPDLHHSALENLRHYRSATQQCRQIDLYCMDAAEFAVPTAPTVFYFYNPFDEVVMRKVLTNIRHSLRAHPRQAFVLYCNHRLQDLLPEFGFEVINSSFWYSVFRNRNTI